MADVVEQGAVWSDLTEPVLDLEGDPITTAIQADFAVVLLDSADIDRSSGVTVVHSTGGRYRLEKTIAADAATGSWGGTVTYDDGSLLTWEQSIDFSVVADDGDAEPETPSVLAADETLTLTIGYSYLPGDGDPIQFENENWTVYDIENADAVWFAAITPGSPIRVDMDVLDATSIQLELTATQTYRMRSAGSYKVYASLPGQTDPVVLVSGSLSMQSA